MRVFVGPFEIAGYYGGLAEALRGIGVDAIAVDLGAHRYRYVRRKPASIWVRAATWAERRWVASRGQPRAMRLPWLVLRAASRMALLAWAITRFDAFIFGYGTTLLFTRELPLLRLLRKRLVFVFNGSDARPPYIDGADMAPSRGMSIEDCIALAARKKALIRRIERYANTVVSVPTYSHFFEKPVVDYLRIGTPVSATLAAVGSGDASGEIRILHSPSDPEVKGSDRIREAVAAVRARGLPVGLIELREVTHAEVLAEIERADLVIDQAFSDVPMAVFAAEAAAAGVPAIVGSYAWRELRVLYADSMMPPVEGCHPDGLAAAIQRLAEDPEYRKALGGRARSFVETEWEPARIAERYLEILSGETPQHWLFDPKGVSYLRGVGLPEDRTREIVDAVIARGGRAALQLADKPALERAAVDFADAG